MSTPWASSPSVLSISVLLLMRPATSELLAESMGGFQRERVGAIVALTQMGQCGVMTGVDEFRGDERGIRYREVSGEEVAKVALLIVERGLRRAGGVGAATCADDHDGAVSTTFAETSP